MESDIQSLRATWLLLAQQVELKFKLLLPDFAVVTETEAQTEIATWVRLSWMSELALPSSRCSCFHIANRGVVTKLKTVWLFVQLFWHFEKVRCKRKPVFPQNSSIIYCLGPRFWRLARSVFLGWLEFWWCSLWCLHLAIVLEFSMEEGLSMQVSISSAFLKYNENGSPLCIFSSGNEQRGCNMLWLQQEPLSCATFFFPP